MAEMKSLTEALEKFVNTVEATGGVVQTEVGLYEPRSDPEWIDLGDAYILACKALGKEPLCYTPEEWDELDEASRAADAGQ